MTAEQPAHGEPAPAGRAVAMKGLNGIRRAAGDIAAGRRTPMASGLVTTDQPDEHSSGGAGRGLGRGRRHRWPLERDEQSLVSCFQMASSACMTVSRSSPNRSWAEWGATPIKYMPGRNCGARSPTMVRSWRRIRFRSTALPTLRPMAYATRGGSAGFPLTKDTVTGPICDRDGRDPLLAGDGWNARNSDRPRTRQIRRTAACDP